MMISSVITIAITISCIAVDGFTTPSSISADSNAIDQRLSQLHREHGIQPASLTNDLQFLRRLTLDLVGRIPTINEIQAFEKNPVRENKIDELLESEEFSEFISEVWTEWLIGYSDAFQTDRETFRIWLKTQIRDNESFQKIVSAIITAEGSCAINGPANFLARHFEQPEAAISRSFLGVRIECAQCHDHPFDRWTQDDYQSFKRYFEPLDRIEREGVVHLTEEPVFHDDHELPRFLTGARPRTSRYRQELSLYLTSCKPFARNFANRVWYFLMGQGIVDPPDDLNQENRPIDGKLLNQLAEIAIERDFKIKDMVRIICRTKAYQRKSDSEHESIRIRFFAARKIKPLLPIQLVDSLFVALEKAPDANEKTRLLRRMINQQALDEDYQLTWQYRWSSQQLMQIINFQFRTPYHPKTEQFEINDVFRRFLTRNASEQEVLICKGRQRSDISFALALGNEFSFNH